ncbi:3'-5' exonuclease [Paracoccus aeridis]|uniref:3'-5' exonuclease n=1 Tax=Paracoccus aeridis TaxID=1966466 RepID=UPI00191C5F47|nr:3'-5' exoribonuclease [Paracoccus aeridis]
MADIKNGDAYISVDVETDGPIPGPYSMLALGMAYCGSFDGRSMELTPRPDKTFYVEIKPISDEFEYEALHVNGLDRRRLANEGTDPKEAMESACNWIDEVSGDNRPIFVAYPASFDWLWVHWYFTRFTRQGSPFGHSGCFDLKTAVAVKGRAPISMSSKSQLPSALRSDLPHTHNALDDAIEQANIFFKLMVMTDGRPNSFQKRSFLLYSPRSVKALKATD